MYVLQNIQNVLVYITTAVTTDPKAKICNFDDNSYSLCDTYIGMHIKAFTNITMIDRQSDQAPPKRALHLF